jgi:hypothetical protein
MRTVQAFVIPILLFSDLPPKNKEGEQHSKVNCGHNYPYHKTIFLSSWFKQTNAKTTLVRLSTEFDKWRGKFTLGTYIESMIVVRDIQKATQER